MKLLKNRIINGFLSTRSIIKSKLPNFHNFLKHNFNIILKISFGFLFLCAFWKILPNPLFHEPICTVLIDRNGELLGAHIADDGQYRFPESKTVPEKFKQSLIAFEDKRFYKHIGVDFLSLARAFKQNISKQKKISGGSTLTMQLIRLSRKIHKRTIYEKLIEVILAFRLELSYSKDEILALYASHAPFGGNVVGLEAASWRYFGVGSEKLSWAQSATLAVLPNSPGLIHPGRNREALLQKRNRLLLKLLQKQIIDNQTYELAVEEDVPQINKAFPDIAHHLLMRAKTEKILSYKTTLDYEIQNKINQIVNENKLRLSGNNINNIAVLVSETESGNVIAYIGNINDFSDDKNQNSVDIIQAERSTGSILKPFLYAAMLTEGDILPNTLVFDIPTRIGGYTPKNYQRAYDGAVPAHKALARSLNIPAVRMLQTYGIEKFYNKLKAIGLSSLHQIPDHYGLSLILGGCEGSLWELCGIYASMARTLLHYEEYGYQYNKKDFHPLKYYSENTKADKKIIFENHSFFSASAVYYTFQAMIDVERPDDESNWEMFRSSEKIAWKTGTSFGFRDAWAIGVTPKYVVGVWVGNADGEGRPGIVGLKAAAPILFNVFDVLPDAENWFQEPLNDMIEADICKISGHLASPVCNEIEKQYIPIAGIRSDPCPYHTIIHLDSDEQYRVNGECESVNTMHSVSWFVLPPTVEFYYKKHNASYQYLPPFRTDCEENADTPEKNMELIYPYHNTVIYVPIELNGQIGKTVFEATHRNKNIKIFWYIDDKPLGVTVGIHQIELSPKPGVHSLTLLDEHGEKIIKKFEIIGRN